MQDNSDERDEKGSEPVIKRRGAMNYMKDSAAHTVEETQSTIVLKRKKETRCEDFAHIVDAVMRDHPDAKTHIDSESGGYDKIIILK